MQSKGELLQQLYVDVTENTGHLISRTQFHQLIRGLLSYDGSKCLKENPNHIKNDTIKSETQSTYDCQQNELCRKETLLMLTCLKVILESQIEEDLLDKKEGAESGSRKTSAVVRPLIEELVAVDILSILLSLADNQGKLISYAACKALITAVECTSFSERKETLIQDLLSRVMRSDPSSTAAPYLDILTHFMSNRSGEQTNAWCFQTLITSEIFGSEFLKNILTSIDTNSIDKPVTLLTLLQKSIKYLNKLDKEIKQIHLQALFCPVQKDLLAFLVSCLQSVHQSHWRILCKRTLDIFNTLFNYGSHLAQQKAIPYLCSQTASRVLSVACSSVLLSMPYVCEFVGLGGSSVERSDDEDFEGDLGLLRKLFLVLLKSCAILFRTKSTSCQVPDSEQVSTCLISLTELMTKTFNSPHADFQWLPLVFADQDDAWVEALLCLLDVYLNSPRSPTTSPICSQTNPHSLFLQFLDSNSSDYMVIVDLLTSPETCFLLYLLRYLKCIVSEWEQFTFACHRKFPHGPSSSNNMDNFNSTDSSSRDVSEILEVTSCQNENVLATNNIDICTPVAKKIKLISPCKVKEKRTLSLSDFQTADNFASKGSEGLASLTAYSDSDSAAEEDCSPVHSVTPETELSRDPYVSHSNIDSELVEQKSLCDRVMHTAMQSISEQTSDSIQDEGFAKLDTSFSYPDFPPDGSTVSCDLQCVESVSCDLQCVESVSCDLQCVESVSCDLQCVESVSCDLQCVESVMGTLIRVRLRMERLSEQRLFPYNPDPLLTLLEHCESLYESKWN